MTNEELKKKIEDILEEYNFETDDGEGWVLSTDEIADALIAAGIGDVSELKKHRVVVEKSLIPEDDNAYVLPNIPPTVKQLYSGEEVEQIVKEREEYKYRADVAERALRNVTERASCNICDNFSCRYYEGINYDYNAEECIKWWLAQAEKELAEEGEE